MDALTVRPSDGRALVLGAGGVTGIAWLTGMVHGLAEHGVALIDASLIEGTSAGACVAAQLSGETDIPSLFARQVDPRLQVNELEPSPQAVRRLIDAVSQEDGMDEATRLRRRALLARDTPEYNGKRREVIRNRLTRDTWPSTNLKLCAVDIDTGEPVLFDSGSGVSLVDAVEASCAVPGIWPPVTINGKVFIDGGVRSTDNADLVTDCGRVLILAPAGRSAAAGSGKLDANVRALGARGATVMAITPDDRSLEAFGVNPFSAERRADAAQAGYEQALVSWEEIKSLWDMDPGFM